ncbi:hypothetical protein [Rhizobium sp. 18065]|uniref:hypothetical protein n=2 Tax=Pseudomonadati TaxID=3379134 RepID=UPI001359F22F|nr:hypothetical protein [Rhizobium sp. 18065]
MTEIEPQTRLRLEARASDIIQRLPAMGKLMIIGKGKGATHERIGTVETVTEISGKLVCGGIHHKSSIDPNLIADVIFDTSSIMQNQVYPRLDFRKADGATLFAAVGFEGLEPFEAALADIARSKDPSTRDMSRPQRPELNPADPGIAPLNQALEAATPVTIRYDEPGFSQSWTGIVSKVSPGMGFINVMTEDFHLHLLGGTVAHWAQEAAEVSGERLCAVNSAGERIGLTLVLSAPASNAQGA